jgi:hypothetical protein
MNAATLVRMKVAGWMTIALLFAASAGAVQPITSIQAHYDSLDDSSEDFAINGGGSGAFPTGTVYQSRFTVGTFDNLVIDAFDVGTNNFIFRQLAQRISIVRVDNPTITGAHHILLYDQEGAILRTPPTSTCPPSSRTTWRTSCWPTSSTAAWTTCSATPATATATTTTSSASTTSSTTAIRPSAT